MINKKYGRLKVIEEVDQLITKKGTKIRIVNCICDCGNEKLYRRSNILSGHTKSCGCLRKELTKKRSTKHGLSETKIYRLWRTMLNRCYLKSCSKFYIYGKRGIRVCKRWHDFENFYADMGEKPKNMSIGRIDNNSNYSPKNCRWETAKQQGRNTRSNKILVFNGERKCLVEWAEIYGINPSTLNARISISGWSIEKALTTPVTCTKYKAKEKKANKKLRGDK